MKELNSKDISNVSGGVEIPTPSLGDALIAIAKEIYYAFR